MNYSRIWKKITLFLLLAFLAISAFPANAALLKVTMKPDKIQIPSAGTTNLNITVTYASNGKAVGGAVLTFTASPAACTPPANNTTDPQGKRTVVFTGPAVTSTIVCKITVTATSGASDSGSAAAIVVVGDGYAPLVPLPGIGTPTSFPAYLAGLYKLALMSIGIFAFLMILYGGFKYMTSAGNPAFMGDAKDAIYSAILGLILASLSFLILTTVNPELTMLYNPGTNPFAVMPSAGTTPLQCSKNGELTQRVCECINDRSIIQTGPPPPYSTCNRACEVFGNGYCLKAKLSLKKYIPATPLPEISIDGSLYNSEANPLITETISWFQWDIKTNSIISDGPYLTGCIDGTMGINSLDNTCNANEVLPLGILAGNLDYTVFTVPSINRHCSSTDNPKGVLCPFKYWVTDQSNNTSVGVIWIKMLAPGQ